MNEPNQDELPEETTDLAPSYPDPVARLLANRVEYGSEWADYTAEGLTAEHIPDLIRMATASDARWGNREDDEENLAAYAPVHAWRALGQLRATEAVEPLAALLTSRDDDDRLHEELPEVFAKLGPDAIPALATLLATNSQGERAGLTATQALQHVGQAHPDARAAAIAGLVQTLEQFETNDPGLNGFIVLALCELKAVEAAPLIERAFTADGVDESIMGGWGQAEYMLGLRDDEPPYIPSARWDPNLRALSSSAPANDLEERTPARPRPANKSRKAKRKQEKSSRKQNRKKKK